MTQLACQTITWGPERLTGDYGEVVREVASIGFAGVETNCRILRQYAEELPKLREQHQIRFVAGHTGFDDLQQCLIQPTALRDLKSTLRNAQVSYLLVSHRQDVELNSYSEVGHTLATIQSQLSDSGVTVLFHNHHHELEQRWEPLRRICEAAGQSGVGLAVDFGWALRSKADPVALVDSVGKWIRYAHFKDFRGDNFVELGEGDIGLPSAVPAIKSLDLDWWVAEQDHSDQKPKDSAKQNYEFLQRSLRSNEEGM